MDEYIVSIEHCTEDDENLYVRVAADTLEDAVKRGFSTYAQEVLDRSHCMEYALDEIEALVDVPAVNGYNAYVFPRSIVLPDEDDDVSWDLNYPFTPPMNDIWVKAKYIRPGTPLDGMTNNFSDLRKQCTVEEGRRNYLDKVFSLVKK